MTREEAIQKAERALNDPIAKGGGVALLELDHLRVLLEALRGPQPAPYTGLKGCWHCRNIEAHHIEYVIAVKAKGGTPMNMPVDCPYHYCPACGRKLEVEG